MTESDYRLLDLFCGAGGAARGYQLAGFHVTGVDVAPQPRYAGDAFVQADALDYLARHGHEYDAVHASPPCQHYAPVTRWRGSADDHPDLVGPTRAALARSGRPWVIENVPGSPVRADYLLCGTMFGLRVKRHRLFEVPWAPHLWQPGVCRHAGVLPFGHKGERAYADAMGCAWMTAREAREAIPPAFTAWIGAHLRALLQPLEEIAS